LNGVVGVRERDPHFLQWGSDPKSTNPHNSGPEVDIDLVPTAFIVRLVLKRDIVKAIQVTPPHATPPPPNRKTPISRFPIDNFWPKFANQ